MASAVDELLSELGGEVKLLTPAEIIGRQNLDLLRRILETQFAGSLEPGQRVALMFGPDHPGGLPIKVCWPA